MIGILASPSEYVVLRELFELFKTPWEIYRSNRRYDVLLCIGNESFVEGAAKLVLFYGGQELEWDKKGSVAVRRSNGDLSYKRHRLPIYGDSVIFPGEGSGVFVEDGSLEPAMRREVISGAVFIRIGYSLVAEVRKLLTAGQPAMYASSPTLELHIALLRDVIVENGITLVEIPPIPDGYRFVACLTHDVDHPSIFLHKWDRTMCGFMYRAVVGSLGNAFRGRMPARDLFRNWIAALKLPFVYLGCSRDFWRDFGDRYLDLEKGVPSTFFVIPFRGKPGRKHDGQAPAFRAARYGAADIRDVIAKLTSAGCEVGLHGIDAWVDSSEARKELEEIRRLTGASEIGVRMHWLYYDERSPAILDEAEAEYDSTVGYNETVGYRAGTTQAYKPFQAARLLELPMHVMDTAMFYPAYLGLSSRQAVPLLNRMVENAVEFGGCFTINWHDRSLDSERLWLAPYSYLVQELKRQGAWFATAGQAVSWFRKRRAVVFEMGSTEAGEVSARIGPQHSDGLPGLRLRIHRRREGVAGAGDGEGYVDVALDRGVADWTSYGVGA